MMKIITLFIAFMIITSVDAATITVGDGSLVDFGGATVVHNDLSIDNQGDLRLTNTSINLTDFSNQFNGLADISSSLLNVMGDWFNEGSIIASNSSVRFIDGIAQSNVIGNTTFNELVANTNSGKTLSFQAGSQTVVTDNLDFTGIANNLLTIVSDTPGSHASLFLEAGASQNIDYVDVSDNFGIGQPIAPDLAINFNSIQGNNVRGWFGIGLVLPVPVNGFWSLMFMILMVLVIHHRSQRKTLKGDQ